MNHACWFRPLLLVSLLFSSLVSVSQAPKRVTPSGPVVSLSPSSLSFGAVPENTTSSAQVITLTNTGTSVLDISPIAIGGNYSTQFSDTPTTCGSTLAASHSCTVTVKFTPTYLGPKTGSVTFTTNAPSSPDSVPITTAIGVASGMVLYPGGQENPLRQVSVFGGPINVNSTDYSFLIGTNGILNSTNLNKYLTGVTTSLNLSCVGSNCTGANGTYLDHGTSCPSLVFNTGTNPIDTFVNAVAQLGYINNFILVNTSYGGGSQGNTATASYVWTQAWADSINNDCSSNKDVSLTRNPSGSPTYYLPGDYIYISSNYWQMTNTACTVSGDSYDDRCLTQSGGAPACFTNGSSTCNDGTAIWTKMTTGHAPPLDGWCDANNQGANCYSLAIDGAVTIPDGNHVTITVTNPPTWHTDGSDTVTIVGTPSGKWDCPSCQVTGSTATTVTYNLAGKSSGTATTGTISGAHSLNINTPNASTVLPNVMPVPYEQPNRRRMEYLFSQIDAHYKNSIGYVRLGLTKGGESSQDGIAGWPWYTASNSTNQYASYEKIMYAYEGANGCGTDFACVGNLNTNPSVEAGYMYSNNIGFDNNALSTNQIYTLDYFTGGLPNPGTLYHGGDWAIEFSTYNKAQSNGQFPVTTLQSTSISTPGTCNTGTCSAGSCTTGGGPGGIAVNGAMSKDPYCTTDPFSSDFPGDLPKAQAYLTNNNELYFCDAALGLLTSTLYNETNSCQTHYPSSTYKSLYEGAFSNFIAY
ncbi:MAG: choice-of-anchor D domain-containing protein [Candidatus Sulfotelmatobacter sp.]